MGTAVKQTIRSAPNPLSGTSGNSQISSVNRLQNITSKNGSSMLPSSLKKGNIPLGLRIRRLWKKWNDKDSNGRRSTIGSMIAAFKMGLYFKVILAILLSCRFLSHSAQMTFPSRALTRDVHFTNLRSAKVSPSLRVIVMTQRGDSSSLKGLLQSLESANYEGEDVALDVWMFASSTCNALPLPLYIFGVVAFGPPRFDHSIAEIVRSFKWSHGKKSLIAVRSEPDWAGTWAPSRGTSKESIVYIDASRARVLSPAYYIWLKRAKAHMKSGMQSNVAIYALDAIEFSESSPVGENAILLESFLPSTAVFSPTRDIWVTFLSWHAKKVEGWFARPRPSKRLHIAGFDVVESFRIHPLRAWLTQFLFEFEERIMHPLFAGQQTLLVRKAGSTGAKVPGAGDIDYVHLAGFSEEQGALFMENPNSLIIPEQPSVIKWDGSLTTFDEPFGQQVPHRRIHGRQVVVNDVVRSIAASRKHARVLSTIAEFSRARGGPFVALTLVTRAFTDTALSWLCNVVSLDITPAALVLVTTDDFVKSKLDNFLSAYPRLSKAAKVVSLQGAVAAVDGVSSRDDALQYGSSEYWLLMLERTILLRDLLNHGVSILHFETDQIWLSDPIPYIRHAIEFGEQRQYGSASISNGLGPDMVISRTSGGDVAGNFFYMRPSACTRHMWSEIAYRFFKSYKKSLRTHVSKHGSRYYVRNDQSLLTALVLGRDRRYRRKSPGVRYTALNRDLFVDGKWFKDFKGLGRPVENRRHYTSEESRFPVVLNNNELNELDARTERAKRYGVWFWRNKNWTCNAAAAQQVAAFGGRGLTQVMQKRN